MLLGPAAFSAFAFPGSLLGLLLADAAAAVLCLAACLRSAEYVSAWRRREAGDAQPPKPRWLSILSAEFASKPEQSGEPAFSERLFGRISGIGRRLAERVGSQALRLGFGALLALVAVRLGWASDLPAQPDSTAALVGVAFALAAAFCFLVFERRLSNQLAETWPEAAALGLLVRVPLVVLLGSAGALLLAADGLRAGFWLGRLLPALPALVASELLLRAIVGLFSPPDPAVEPQFLGRSVVSGLLVWPPRPFSALGRELREGFGVDLRQVWAFSFIRRASAPVALGVLFLGWLCSGVQQVPLDGRAIYERLGKPVAVLQPGLHLGLPWPMSRAVAVENGVVHEVAATAQADAPPVSELAPAEGPAPPAANRLWDVSHDSETAQVIAGAGNDSRTFQIVNMDVRFIYRVGLSDADALAAAYRATDPAGLVRSAAGRVLVHELATRTLDGVLGASRKGLAEEIRNDVQADLNRLGLGIEVLSAVIEAIHPPAGAADAYHGVQAAQINAQGLISVERGRAAETANDAQRIATAATDEAEAGAKETGSAAQELLARFRAEEDAFAASGKAFLLERYLGTLSGGLGQASLTIIDRRIGSAGAPTIDLRAVLPPGNDLPPAGSDDKTGKESAP